MKISVFLSSLIVAAVLMSDVFAQTAGIGVVTDIESRSLLHEANQLKMIKLKGELPELLAIWRAKLQALKDEILALQKERDNIIADMKVGARCSECKRWKTELERQGINFTEHLGAVKGYAIPATTTELERVRKEFSDKLAYKKVQIQGLEKGDKLVLSKQEEIDNLQKNNKIHCTAITTQSNNYETKVLSEGKGKHDIWAEELLRYVSNILIADDRISIFKAKGLRCADDFLKESAKTKEKLKNDHTESQNNLGVKIDVAQQKINEAQVHQKNDLNPIEVKVSGLMQKKLGLEKDLNNVSIPDSGKVNLKTELNKTAAEIVLLEKEILEHKNNYRIKVQSLENEIKTLKAQLAQLNLNYPKLQLTEIAKVKSFFDQKKLEAAKSEAASITELANAKKVYLEKVNDYKQRNQVYLAMVVSECNRIVLAGQKIDCPVWKDVQFKVAGNWNELFSCVNALTKLTKPYSSNVFNTYCSGRKSGSDLPVYKSFLLGLSADDREAVRGNSNANWFESITQ